MQVGGIVQRRTPRGACEGLAAAQSLHPDRGLLGRRLADDATVLLDSLSIDDEGRRRWAPDHPGGRVADRRFSFAGRADPSDQHQFAAELLPPTPRTSSRATSLVIHTSSAWRGRVRRAYRRLLNSESSLPTSTPVGGSIPSAIRRALGRLNYPADRFDRESKAPRNRSHVAARRATRRIALRWLLGVSRRAPEPHRSFSPDVTRSPFRGLRGRTGASASR